MTSRDESAHGTSLPELYQALFDSGPDATLVTDSAGKIVAANALAEKLFGYAASELIGEPIEILIPDRFRKAHERHRKGYIVRAEARPMGSGLDLWARYRNGTVFPVEISLSPLRFRGQTLVSAAVRDVTERKEAEYALLQARDQLQDEVRTRSEALAEQLAERDRTTEQLERQSEMLDLVSEAIFAWSMERGIVFWNKAAADTYGYTHEDAVGRVSHDLLATVAPEGIPQVRETLRRFGRWEGELLQTARDGRRIVAETRMALLRTRDGEQIVLESCHDVTAQRAAEEALRQSQKIEAVGQLTGGIAHDFNNLLTIILANLQLMEDALAPGSDSMELANSATRAAQRGAELTRKLLIFARRQRLEPRALDVNELVSTLTGMLARTLGERIHIAESLAPGLPNVLIDAAQLETALLNLAINSRDAMPHGGRLSIETTEATVEANDERVAAGLAPGAYVVVAVSDSGTGMTRDVIARAFEPFFTTKEAGKGTGLGLSMVYGFVKQSGGHVTLYSEPGYGTTIKLYLPQATSADSAASERSTPQASGSETVLLVEDDDEVRAATRKLLAGFGYRVVEAADADTALSLAKQGGIHLLLTDVVLGDGMSGPELAREARRLAPGLKVLFMSGHVRDTVAFHEELQQDAHFLAKPFRKTELADKVRAALGSPER